MSHVTRIRSLDGLRGIAALAVVAFHSNIFFLPRAGLPFVGRAYLAVDLFFLLSGFVMAHVYGRELASDYRAHWLKFAIARFARIYPLFALTTLAMIIGVTLSDIRPRFILFSGWSLALQPFLLQQWSNLSWNYPSWSISTEAEAYIYFIFFAGLLLTGKFPRLIGISCACLLAALCIANSGSLNLCSGIYALLRTLAEFSIGVLLYRAYSGHPHFLSRWAAILGVLCVALTAITKLDCFTVAALACLICYAVDATGGLGRSLNSRPAVALGNWSYSIYLWHAPIHLAVMTSFAASGHSVARLDRWDARFLLLATTIVVVGLSALSYQYFETPMRCSLTRHATTTVYLWRARWGSA
jgi:peptidoglycan/LPS O-acetylase OafA/YrhL